MEKSISNGNFSVSFLNIDHAEPATGERVLAAALRPFKPRDSYTLEPALEGCEGLFHVAADYRLGARDPTQLYRTLSEQGNPELASLGRPAGQRRPL